jgi:hypothetical protein
VFYHISYTVKKYRLVCSYFICDKVIEKVFYVSSRKFYCLLFFYA